MENLRKLREAEGLTQIELAKMLNVSQKEIELFETGTKYPKIATLKQMANIFYVSIDILLDFQPIFEKLPTIRQRKFACKIFNLNEQDLKNIENKLNSIIKEEN